MTAINTSTPNGIHDVVSSNSSQSVSSSGSLRLPILTANPSANSRNSSNHLTHSHAVFMYSTAADGNVTLQLRDTCSGDDCAEVLTRCSGNSVTNGDLPQGVTTLSISYQDIATDLLGGDSNGIDILLGAAPCGINGAGTNAYSTTATLHAASAVTGENGEIEFESPRTAGGQDESQTFTITSNSSTGLSDNGDSSGALPQAQHDATEVVQSSSEDVKKTIVLSASEVSKLAVKRPRPKAASPNRQGPQQCQVCSKVFGNASALAKHKLTHSDERKYVCIQCGKAFKRQDHLNGHMLTHRNKKPYECKAEGCGKSYCDARSLRRHTENHHNHSTSSSQSSNSSVNSSVNASSTTTNASGANTLVDKPINNQLTQSVNSGTQTVYSSSTKTSSLSNSSASSSLTITSSAASKASTPASLICGNASVSASTLSPAQGAASGDAASPHGAASSTCIQYAPPESKKSDSVTSTGQVVKHFKVNNGSGSVTAGSNSSIATTCSTMVTTSQTSGKSQLQQLLSSEPKLVSTNDGLTKQQLDLIHQIMEQSQARPGQGQSRVSNAGVTTTATMTNLSTSMSNSVLAITNRQKLCRAWSLPNQSVASKGFAGATGQSLTNASNSSSSTASTLVQSSPQQCNVVSSRAPNTQPSPAGSLSAVTSDTQTITPKPVECNLCHRKFKNIPALNGHMRLHGGYIKKVKDTDAKKSERKDSGPPLQTASVSVRALIEEKIINKRISSPQTSNIASSQTDNQTINQSSRSCQTTASSHFTCVSSVNTENKFKPKLDGEKFKAPTINAQRADVLADFILKRGGVAKVVRRSTSEPGANIIHFEQGRGVQNTFTVNGVNYTATTNEDGVGYFSPTSGQFQQDVLLQSVNSQYVATDNLSSSILQQQNSSSEHMQNLSLEYTQIQDADDKSYASSHSVNQELQAVLNSPLPESLAEFSTYHSGISSPKDVLNQSYTSPRHDSSPMGNFTYPTPPASHDGQSPNFSNGILPLLSPHSSDNFMQNSRDDEPPQASSPLSAAFYTSTMSSAEAVEEALEEVLPGETISSNDLYTSFTNSPPPPRETTPLGETPVHSPTPTPMTKCSQMSQMSQISFPSSQFTIQSQMMPNSDDPLLSSNPKDFVSSTSTQTTKKRIEVTNNLQSFKIISSNGLVDLSNQISGILVDANGELKFIQTSGMPKNIVVSTGNVAQVAQVNHNHVAQVNQIGQQGQPTTVQIIQPSNSLTFQNQVVPKDNEFLTKILNGQSYLQQQLQGGRLSKNTSTSPMKTFNTIQYTVPGRFVTATTTKPKLHISTDMIKQEDTDDVFLSPSSIPASPSRVSRKRPRSEPPVVVPVTHQSRLRSHRKTSGSLSYTPAPMLNPSRPGTGLYTQAKWKAVNNQTKLAYNNRISFDKICPSASESVPESDTMPHINIGPHYQCNVPELALNVDNNVAQTETLLWHPTCAQSLTQNEMTMYLEFACCAAVPGGGRNQEYALHLLNLCDGNVHKAMLMLMEPAPSLPKDHPLLSYQYCDSSKWSQADTEAFHRALLKHNKNFHQIAKEMGTKSTKECVEFYYVWKKICTDDYKRVRNVYGRSHRDTPPTFACNASTQSHDMSDNNSHNQHVQQPTATIATATHTQELRSFCCEYPDCTASFNSRAALNGHIRIHGGTVRRSPTPNQSFDSKRVQVCVAQAGVTQSEAKGGVATRFVLTDVSPSVSKTSNSATSASSSAANTIIHDHSSLHHNNTHPHQTTVEFPCKVCGKIFSKIKSRSAHMKSHRPPDAEPKRPSKSSSTSSPTPTKINVNTSNAVLLSAWKAALSNASNSRLTNNQPPINHMTNSNVSNSIIDNLTKQSAYLANKLQSDMDDFSDFDDLIAKNNLGRAKLMKSEGSNTDLITSNRMEFAGSKNVSQNTIITTMASLLSDNDSFRSSLNYFSNFGGTNTLSNVTSSSQTVSSSTVTSSGKNDKVSLLSSLLSAPTSNAGF